MHNGYDGRTPCQCHAPVLPYSGACRCTFGIPPRRRRSQHGCENRRPAPPALIPSAAAWWGSFDVARTAPHAIHTQKAAAADMRLVSHLPECMFLCIGTITAHVEQSAPAARLIKLPSESFKPLRRKLALCVHLRYPAIFETKWRGWFCSDCGASGRGRARTCG